MMIIRNSLALLNCLAELEEMIAEYERKLLILENPEN